MYLMANISGFPISISFEIGKRHTSKGSKFLKIGLEQSAFSLIASAYSEAYTKMTKTWERISFYDCGNFNNILKLQSFIFQF